MRWFESDLDEAFHAGPPSDALRLVRREPEGLFALRRVCVSVVFVVAAVR